MMKDSMKENRLGNEILTKEQENLLDLYLDKLDYLFEQMKAAEKVQVEIETLHLKKILSK